MEDRLSTLESRVEQLAARVEALTAKVDGISTQMDSFRSRPLNERTAARGDAVPDAAEEMLSWVRKSSLLQRLSTLCFLLVVALILRTVTDNRIIDLRLGSVIGMIYAAALMFIGWRRYARANPLAPIFTVCGTILMFTVIAETQARFHALPAVPAYILLMTTGLGAAAISYLYRAPAPVAVGNLGMCLAGAAVDYPSPFFPYLGIVLLTANLLGYLTARAHRYSWPRWILLLVTMFMVHLWGIKLGVSVLEGDKLPRMLAPAWFLPFLALFGAAYMTTAFLGIIRSLPGKVPRFDLSLPTINVAWAFILAQYVVFAIGGSRIALGAVGVIAGAGHLAAATLLAAREPEKARGANAFVFAGAVLLALALPVALADFLLSLPVLAAVALWAATLSARWHSGSVRLTSYLLQIYAGAALAVVVFGRVTIPSFWTAAVSAGGLAATGLLQYRWCRSRKPPAESVFFSRIDKGDFGAVVILLAALMSAFLLLREIAQQALSMILTPPNVSNALLCSQSVIINLSAVALMLFALMRRNREVRNVAILVTLIGAVKVFLFDLFRAGGVPLVLSVLSFGLATAVESVILGRWARLSPPAQGNEEGTADS